MHNRNVKNVHQQNGLYFSKQSVVPESGTAIKVLKFELNRYGVAELKANSAGIESGAVVLMDRDTGRSKGFGFVEMGSDAEHKLS